MIRLAYQGLNAGPESQVSFHRGGVAAGYFGKGVATVRPLSFFFFKGSGAPRDFPSFPTRRSSDLRGIGIPAEMREQIFERFVRLNDPALALQPGPGLGLYISRELARRQGAELSVVRSEPGRG